MCDCGLGRVGSFGGVSSPDPKLLGGLLNGEFSWEMPPFPMTVGPEIDAILGGAGISAFSLRGAGGGGGTLASRVLISSPERLGGGGDGGLEPPGRGDLGVLRDGEVLSDRLGILNDRLPPVGVGGVATESGFTNEGWSPTASAEIRPFGGD